MTKDTPKVECLLYNQLPTLSSTESTDVNETTEISKNQEVITSIIDDENNAAKAQGMRIDNKIEGANLVGTYDDVIKMLLKKGNG